MIDANINVKSTKGYVAMKRSILQFLKEKRIFMDECTLQSLDDMQVGWFFGKDSSFIASIERTKKWIVSLLLARRRTCAKDRISN